MHFILALGIFIFTLVLVIKRPFRLGIGYSAMIGAAMTILTGIVDLHDIEVVWGIVWNATFTFVAIILASLIFDEVGFFEYLAIRVAKFSRGNGNLLFLLIIALGALISAFFANDGTALVLTPIVYALLVRSGVDKGKVLPFIMATGFIADTSSLPFVISNLVNIVTASYFGIAFVSYSVVMIIPDMVAIAASMAFLWLFYRKQILPSFDSVNIREDNVVRDPLLFRIAAPFIILLVIAYAAGGFLNVPVAFLAVPAVLLLTLLAFRSGKIDVRAAIRGAPWQIVLFSLGMYIVVFGLGREGMTGILISVIMHVQSLPGPLPVLVSGYLFAMIAAVMNNLPSVMLVNLALMHVQNSSILVYTNIIANDIGPKFTTIGSLATLLWLHTLERKKEARISPWYYTKMGLSIGMPVLTLSLLSLWVVYFVIH